MISTGIGVGIALLTHTALLAVDEYAGQSALNPVLTAQIESSRPDSQRFRIYDAWRAIYDLIPELPLENQYISTETGEPSTNNTLIDRLIRYHVFIKGRPPSSRLDWKFTLADYLGANEPILAFRYPGHDDLNTNPLQGDIAAIAQLNRLQREALIDALVSTFTNAEQGTTAVPNENPTRAPNPVIEEDSTLSPVIVGPGAAELLLP